MVWGAIKSAIGMGGPTPPDGPTELPQYFPVEPRGCERQSQNLFKCLATEATDKARDMERVGLHRSYFRDVPTRPGDPVAAQAVAEDPDNPDFPKRGDNPLDECRALITHYRQCCDRKLKERKNWMLTESVRVQDEYRYKGPSKEDVPIVKSRGV
jgi:hypothetical protein